MIVLNYQESGQNIIGNISLEDFLLKGEWVPVSSKRCKAIKWDGARLFIEFKDAICSYAVSEAVARECFMVNSKGSWVHQALKGIPYQTEKK